MCEAQPQSGCVVLALQKKWRNRVAVGMLIIPGSQGSRGGNPGLQDATALRLRSSSNHRFFVLGSEALASLVNWCPRRDSNPEPTDYESAALTVELQGHNNYRRS